MHNTDILADNEYYTNETIYKNYNKKHYSLIIPNKKTSNTTKRQTKTKNYTHEEYQWSNHASHTTNTT